MKNFLSLLFILGVLVVFFNKILFFNQIFVTGDFLRSDILHQNLPLKWVLYQSWRSGKIPFWTDKIFAGYPLLAEGQMGFFYPLNFLPALIFPFVTAYNLSIFLNFLVAAWGMFFLAKSFGLRYFSSLFSAIAFSLSSFFVLHIVHQNIIATACWLPFLFLSLKKLLETEKIRYLILTSLVIALIIFAGSFQIAFYTLFLTFIFFLISLLHQSDDSVIDGRQRHYQKSLTTRHRPVIRFIIFYFLAVFLGLLLSSIQLFPTLELIKNSTRQAGLGNIALDSLPYHPRNLITFIFPYIFGDPGQATYPHFGESWGMFWENAAYLGLVSLLLAVLSMKDCLLGRQSFRKSVPGLWLIFIISILLALGKYGPFFFLYYLPGFNLFRVTARFLVFAVFALALLAGFGLELVNVSLFTSEEFRQLADQRRRCVKTVVNFFALLLLLVDLFWFGYHYNPTASSAAVLAKPEAAKFLEKELKIGERIFSVGDFLTYDEINKSGWRNNLKDNLNHKNSLGANLNLLWGIENFDGYTGLFLARNEAFKNLIYQGIKVEKDKIEIGANSLKLLGLANVRYLISAFDLEGPGIKKIRAFGQDGKTYKIYKNDFYLPKGILIEKYQSADLVLIFNRLAEENFLAKEELLLEAFPLTGFTEDGSGQVFENKVRLKRAGAGEFVFLVENPKPAWFLLQESFYPGWRAYINDKETTIYPADGMFMTVLVGRGRWEGRFVYQQMLFYLGVFLSGMMVFSFLLFGVYRLMSNVAL